MSLDSVEVVSNACGGVRSRRLTDGDTLGVDGSEVSVLEQGDKVGLSSFLKSHDGRGLETQVGLRKTQD